MSVITKPIITDETGQAIVTALMNTDVVQQRIAEINAAAEETRERVLADIPADYTQLSTDVSSLKHGFVTPEMYGAAGDGETDDTEAVQSAINSGIRVVMPNNYFITDTITISSKAEVVSVGDIIYGGEKTKPVFLITSYNNRLEFNNIIDGDTYQTTGFEGGYHGWQNNNYVAIKMHDTRNNIISFNRIINFTVGLLADAENYGFFNNTIIGKQIHNCKYGIYFNTISRTGWMNCNVFSGILFSCGTRESEFYTVGLNNPCYAVYQVKSNDNAYGMQYTSFRDMVFEFMWKDAFTGFYLTFASHNRIQNLISEITSEAVFALFDMEYIYSSGSGQVTTHNQYSDDNTFVDVFAMGGNTNITYANASEALSSFKEIAKKDTDKMVTIFSHEFSCDTIKIDNNNHSSVRGFSYTPLRYNGNIDAAKAAKADYSQGRNNAETGEIFVAQLSQISLKIDVSYGETYKVIVSGSEQQNANKGKFILKAFDTNGDLISPENSSHKGIVGNFTYDGTNYTYNPVANVNNNNEFSIADERIKHVVIMFSGYIKRIEVKKYGNPVSISKHWGDLEYANFIGDNFMSDAKPTSTKNDETVFVGQRVYNVTSDETIGQFWEFQNNDDVYSWVLVE